MEPTIRAVLYDAVGTLFVLRRPAAEVYADVGRRHGRVRTTSEVARRLREAFAVEERLDAADALGRTDEARELRRWRNIVTRVFAASDAAAACLDVDGPDVDCQVTDGPESDGPERLFDELWRYFAAPDAWRLREEVVERLRRDAAAGRTVGVASNFDARLVAVVRHWLPVVPAENIFVSSLLGRRKPAVEFFRLCEARLALRPEQLLLVGDDRRNDYDGARSAGWHAELVSP